MESNEGSTFIIMDKQIRIKISCQRFDGEKFRDQDDKEIYKIGRQTGINKKIKIISETMKNKKPPIHINQILKLTVNRFGKEGDIIFMYKNFIIFLKKEDKIGINLNEFIKIRITKILPSFALAELVK